MRRVAAIVRKDLILELRGADSTLAMLSMSILVLVAIVFAFDVRAIRSTAAASSALWVALVFAGTMSASRALTAERENGCLRALLASPLDAGALFVAKFLSAFIFMAVAEAAAMVIMVLFFNLNFDSHLARAAAIVAMGVVGFAALATMTAALAGHSRLGDLMVPIIAVPMFVPALIAGVKATSLAMSPVAGGAIAEWIRILIAFDVLFVAAGWMLFEYVARGE